MGSGLALVAIGCLLMAHTEASSTWTVLLPGFIVAGIGLGLANPVIASASVAVVPPQRSGMASGSSNTFRQVGVATGIAGLGAVFQSQVVHQTVGGLSASPVGRQVLAHGGPALTQAVTGGGVREALGSIPSPVARHALLGAYQTGFTSTFNHLMLISTVIAAVGAAAAFGLVRQRDFVPSHAPGTGAGAPEPGGLAIAAG